MQALRDLRASGFGPTGLRPKGDVFYTLGRT